MHPASRAALILAVLSLTGCRATVPDMPPAVSASEWVAYGRTPGSDRHSPLGEITPANVANLEVAWRYRTGEPPASVPAALELTPLVVDGTMYVSTPRGRVMALDPLTGAERWRYDAQVDPALEFGDFVNRGVSTWWDSTRAADAACARRIFLASIDARLIALDARSGTPCTDFGTGGVASLREGLRNAPNRVTEYEQTSPPAVINGLVVVGSAVADNGRTDAASGEVRAFDARTGALRWTWDPVPQDAGDPGHATWRGPQAHRTGGANAWSVIAADPERDLVFVPTSSPSVDYYGGERLGRNLYANSVVALRASTGRVVWHFQTVHHDLWDYDNAAPPALVTVQRDGRDVPAVLQATKTGQLFVLHRETGVPVFPVEERPAPVSDVPGEHAWPTQPVSSALPPLSPQRYTMDDMWGATPADREACRAQLGRLRNEGPFTPPSERGSFVLPSNIGGAHWGGVSYDPVREIVVVPTNRVAAVIILVPRDSFVRERDTLGERIGTEWTNMRGTPYVLKREVMFGPSGAPCTPPPFGALVAVSLRTGDLLWTVPLGTGEGMDRFGLELPSGATGFANLGGAITTASGLVFIAATPDAYLRAFHIETGAELWRAKLPAGGKATPMTYRGADGRQHVAIAAGGDGEIFGHADEIIAFALPSGR